MYFVDTAVFEDPEDDGIVVVHFEKLPITTQGDDLADAVTNAEDALMNLMSALVHKGIVEKFLDQYGIAVNDGDLPDSWTPPPRSFSLGSFVRGMSVPLPLVPAIA